MPQFLDTRDPDFEPRFAALLGQKREADAVEILRRLAPIDQHDRRVWRRLLEHLVDKGQWQEAARVGESAIYVDVTSAKLHALYAKALQAVGRTKEAKFEAESALLCKPKDDEAAMAKEVLGKVGAGH